MPYNEQGEWITPEGYEDYDMEEMFALAASGEEGIEQIVEELLPSFEDWGIAQYGEGYLTMLETADLSEAAEALYASWSTEQIEQISSYVTPYDPHEISQLKRGAASERRKLQQKMLAESALVQNLSGRGGFASSYRGAEQTQDLWSSYLSQGSEISKSLSLGIYSSKGDYLDDMYSTISESWISSIGNL